MPLSPAAAREPIHTRTVTCRGYRRADRLWDIEGHLVDEKTYAFDNEHRGRLQPGDPVHEMWLRLTVDDGLVIRGVEARTDASPFALCGDIAADYAVLVGVTIKPGFSRLVRTLFAGAKGCTHLTELLGPVATTAFQTVFPMLAREQAEMRALAGEASNEERPRLLNTCHAFGESSALVREKWPAAYVPPASAG